MFQARSQNCKTSISGSNPDGASIPIKVYSGDMGNTFGPKGFSIGSSLQVSSSK